MDKPRPCGCKGCRTCLICEKDFNIQKDPVVNKENGTYVYCPYCEKAWPGWNMNDYKVHPNHQESEENFLITNIDLMPWDLSQSGRRKQNFGPKCNFKKRKLRTGNFNGFPKFSKFVQDKFEAQPILKGFQTIEQCSLEYNPIRGASIDPHIDDCWIWGERVVTVNLLADSVLTMTYNEKPTRYNLDCVRNYPAILNEYGNIDNTCDASVVKPLLNGDKYPVIRIPMPRRSLLVMYGSARYNWEHQILRKDILNRRICLAYREFTPPYLTNENKESKNILLKAKEFWNVTN